MKMDLSSFGISATATGNNNGEVQVACPFCKGKHERNSKRKCLSVNVLKGTYYCHRCGAKGHIDGYHNDNEYMATPKAADKSKYRKPDWHAEFINAPSAELDYLVNERKISLETLKALKVSEPWVKMPPKEEDTPPTPLGESAAPEERSSNHRKSEQVIAFNYFLDGSLTNIKYRSIDKRFMSFAGGRVIPYNIDSVKDKGMCAITEGEIDALTLHECGIKSVVSVPAGGNANVRWIDEFWNTHFSNKNYFILALDNDKVGVTLRDALLKRLGAEKCRIVRWSKDCKDANEQLQKHGRKSVISRLERAVHPLMENVYTADEVEQDLQDVFNNRVRHGLTINMNGLDELVSFEPGRLVIMSGRPGEGKSELVDEMAVRLNLLHEWKVAYFSPENVPIALHLRKLSEKITGYRFEPSKCMTGELFNAVKGWLSKNIFHILPKEDRYELDTILETAKMLVERKGIKLLVIDPFNRIEQKLSEGQTELQYISSMLNRLVRFAQQMNVMVLLVAHPRKVNRNTTDGKLRRVEMNDINGSSDFGNKADICLIVDRNDEVGVTTVYVDKVRFKHLGKRGQCHFHYEVLNGRFHPCGIGKSMNHDGESVDRYSNVLWQTESWILPDGMLLKPASAGEKPTAPPASKPAVIAQQTIPFSEA